MVDRNDKSKINGVMTKYRNDPVEGGRIGVTRS